MRTLDYRQAVSEACLRSKTIGRWKRTPEWVENMRKGLIGKLAAEKNPSWKGEAVGYHGIHKWVSRRFGKPTTCEECGREGLTGRLIHWANLSLEYKRERDDWKRLCAKCHKALDIGRKQTKYLWPK